MYVYLDGDKIGDKIENMIILEKIIEVEKFSKLLESTINEIKKYLLEKSDIDLIICAGDDVFFKTDSAYVFELIEEIKNIYFEKTKCTMSAGVGLSGGECLQMLSKEKELIYNKIREK